MALFIIFIALILVFVLSLPVLIVVGICLAALHPEVQKPAVVQPRAARPLTTQAAPVARATWF